MGKKKKKRQGRQGFVSWIRAVIALFLGLYYPLRLLFSGDVDTFTYDASMGMVGGGFDKEAALRMYGPMAAGMVFHVVSGELTQRAKVRSLMPALTR